MSFSAFIRVHMRRLMIVGLLAALAGCASNKGAVRGLPSGPPAPASTDFSNPRVGKPYQINGITYTPRHDPIYSEVGTASWYGHPFHGRRTANGEIYNMNALTAAHTSLPLPSLVRVTNLNNGRSVNLRVNDRGPFAYGRIIDVSKRAAEELGFRDAGIARVRVEILDPNDGQPQLAFARRGRGRAPEPIPEIYAAAPPAPVYVPPAPVAVSAEPTIEDLIAVPAAPPGPGRADTMAPIPDEPRTASAVPTRPEPLPVASPMPDAASVTIPGEIDQGRLYVQAGAFALEENAVDYMLGLNAKAPSRAPVQVSPTEANGTRFFRVRFGPMLSLDDAEDLVASLLTLGHTSAKIVIDH